VASGKGGVGKSTTAANLALALKDTGLTVGILDADIYGPSLPKLFGLSGKPQVRDGKIMIPLEGYGVKVMSIGFLIEEEAPMIWRGPMVMSALQQMMREVDWGTLDVLIIDLPPGTGDVQLSLCQRTQLSGAIAPRSCCAVLHGAALHRAALLCSERSTAAHVGSTVWIRPCAL
jgi:ATP-binding protein involved in chromosome partitioning